MRAMLRKGRLGIRGPIEERWMMLERKVKPSSWPEQLAEPVRSVGNLRRAFSFDISRTIQFLQPHNAQRFPTKCNLSQRRRLLTPPTPQTDPPCCQTEIVPPAREPPAGPARPRPAPPPPSPQHPPPPA